MISYDSYYYGGKGHDFCQDYAIHLEGIKEVRLSDGCGSSELSCLGSRLMCLTDANKDKVLSIYDNLNIASDSLYATYLKLKINSKNEVETTINGDGFAISYNIFSKEITYYRYYYPKNAPEYLAYTWLGQKERWLKDFPDNKRLLDLGSGDGFNIGWSADSESYPVKLDNGDIDLICSDGLESFTDKSGNQVPFLEVIKKLCDFKSLRGEFIKRRIKAFRKEVDKLGWVNHDDVSVAGISFGD